MLRAWEELPDFMRTDEVRPYYDALAKKKGQLFIKRIFDICASIAVLIILSPVMLIIAVLIAKDSKGGVFYRQERVTQYGKIFRIHKFRTMIANA
ncbi:MAG: sugar transferase, partial [Mailhella sp.]